MLAATYVRGLDLLFEDRGSARSYYVQDKLGSTRALANSSGILTDTATYDAYGNLIASSGTTINPYLFTGEWFDSAIGQYYLRARYMNPYVGRFSSLDSYAGDIRDPLSLQGYGYAQADPLAYVDPSGHITVLPSIMGAGWRTTPFKVCARIRPDVTAALVLRALIGIKVTYILGADYLVRPPSVSQELSTSQQGDRAERRHRSTCACG